MKLIVETPRLLLREVDESDADGFFEMDSDPEVARYVGNVPVESREKCLEIIRFVQDQYLAFGMGRWSVLLRETGEFLGWCGPKRMVDSGINGRADFVEVGYRFMRRHWGKGYATEAARATLAYGFDVMELPEIVAYADVRNEASVRVLTKIGLNRGNDFEWEGKTHAWFEKKRNID